MPFSDAGHDENVADVLVGHHPAGGNPGVQIAVSLRAVATHARRKDVTGGRATVSRNRDHMIPGRRRSRAVGAAPAEDLGEDHAQRQRDLWRATGTAASVLAASIAVLRVGRVALSGFSVGTDATGAPLDRKPLQAPVAPPKASGEHQPAMMQRRPRGLPRRVAVAADVLPPAASAPVKREGVIGEIRPTLAAPHDAILPGDR